MSKTILFLAMIAVSAMAMPHKLNNVDTLSVLTEV
jgi:hypothetical protein